MQNPTMIEWNDCMTIIFKGFFFFFIEGEKKTLLNKNMFKTKKSLQKICKCYLLVRKNDFRMKMKNFFIKEHLF